MELSSESEDSDELGDLLFFFLFVLVLLSTGGLGDGLAVRRFLDFLLLGSSSSLDTLLFTLTLSLSLLVSLELSTSFSQTMSISGLSGLGSCFTIAEAGVVTS